MRSFFSTALIFDLSQPYMVNSGGDVTASQLVSVYLGVLPSRVGT